MKQMELLEHTDTVNELLARYGVKFGIYKNQVFKEQLFPFDADEPLVWKSGLTRFSRNPDSFIVNSSQGGGFPHKVSI